MRDRDEIQVLYDNDGDEGEYLWLLVTFYWRVIKRLSSREIIQSDQIRLQSVSCFCAIQFNYF